MRMSIEPEKYVSLDLRRCRWPLFAAMLLSASLTSFAHDAAGPSIEILGPDGQPRLGHVFLDGEAPSLRCAGFAGAGELAVSVQDFMGKIVEQATLKAGEPKAALPAGRGYYWIEAAPAKDGKAAPVYACYAVIAPHKPGDPEKSPFGAMTHYAQGMDNGSMPLLKQLGVASIRDEHYWNSVERKRGEYELPARSKEYMAKLKEKGLDPLVEMTFANKLYDDGKTPHTHEGYAAFAKYGEFLLQSFPDQIKSLEVWNEYNGTWCTGPAAEDRPKHYTEMLKVVYDRLKPKFPKIRILGCACVLIPLPYLEGIFKAGGLNYMDAVVIHPYRGRPEGVDQEVAELRALIKQYHDGKEMPIWVTETGCNNKSEFDWERGRSLFEKGRRESARYLVKQYTLLLSERVERIYWYLATDHREFEGMGLLRSPKSPLGRLTVAPAYISYANLIRQLEGAAFDKRECLRPYTRTRVYRFVKDGAPVVVAWAAKPASIRLTTAVPMQRVDLMGQEAALAPEDGKLTVPLDATPVFIKGAYQAIEEIPGDDVTLADSSEDFSKQQGKNNWYYGAYEGGCSGDTAAFKPLEITQTTWGYDWASKKYPYLKLSQDNAHPGAEKDKPVWAVYRWKCTHTGKATLAVEAHHGEKGDGTGIVILVDGKACANGLVGGNHAKETESISCETDVKEGAWVEFALTPGPGTNVNFDATGFHATVKVKKQP